MSKGLVGGNVSCRDKTSSWYQTGSPMHPHWVNSSNNKKTNDALQGHMCSTLGSTIFLFFHVLHGD